MRGFSLSWDYQEVTDLEWYLIDAPRAAIAARSAFLSDYWPAEVVETAAFLTFNRMAWGAA